MSNDSTQGDKLAEAALKKIAQGALDIFDSQNHMNLIAVQKYAQVLATFKCVPIPCLDTYCLMCVVTYVHITPMH